MEAGEWDSAAPANGELDHTSDRKIPIGEFCGCPYRKPTQVGGVRILRRASKLSLRNSAN